MDYVSITLKDGTQYEFTNVDIVWVNSFGKLFITHQESGRAQTAEFNLDEIVYMKII